MNYAVVVISKEYIWKDKIMVKDVIVKQKSYKNKLGEEKTDFQFYLVLDNNKKVRIAPYRCTIKGKEWDTFKELLLVAHSESNDEE